MDAEKFLEFARVLPEPLLFVRSEDATIIAVNPSFSELTGIKNESLQEKTLYDFSTTDHEKIKKYLKNCSRSSQMVIGALTLPTIDGDVREFRCEGAVVAPRSDESSAMILLRVKQKESAESRFVLLTQKIEELSKEIAERRRAEIEREQIYERFHLAEQASNGFIYEWQPQANWVKRSLGVTKVLGYLPEEVDADVESWRNLIHPDDLPRILERFRKKVPDDGSFEEEYRVRHKDGRWIYLVDRGVIKFNEKGLPERIIGFSVDITERKIAEQKLSENEERLRLFVEHAPASVAMLDNEMRYLAVSNHWLEDFKLDSEIIGRSHYEVFPEIPEQWKAIHRRCLAGAIEKNEEELFERENGSQTWLKWEIRPWFTTADEIGGIVIFSEDVTDRKRENLNRELLLNLGEKIRYGNFAPEKLLDEVTKTVCEHLNAARCLFIEINETENRGTIKHEYCKPGVSSVAGEYKISDYSAQTLEAIKSGRTIVNCDAATDQRTADIYKTTYEPYGEQAYVSIPLFTGSNWSAVFWISDDKIRQWTKREIVFLEAIGERTWLAVEKLRKDEALRQSRERLQMAMDAAMIYSWEMNLLTREIQWSSNLEQVLGFSLPSDFEMTVDDLIHPEDQELTRQKILDAINGKARYESEFRLVNPYDGAITWVRGQGVVLTDSNDKQPRFVGITQNITERKKAEQEREEILMREQQARLEAEEASRLKDEFLATVSHELRTPLNAILGWSQLLASGSYNGGDIARPLETIYRNAKSQAQLVEDILDVSRIITGKLRIEPQSTLLAIIVQSAVETLRPALEAKNIKLQLQMNHEPFNVHADPNRLQQVIWNLLSNAIKFTPEKGQVTIALESDEREARIIVSDTGKGISAEFLPHVFERFRQADGTSTRSHGGLGLGLAIVRHIVELHGGTVEANSDGENMGTTFIVRLPLREKEVYSHIGETAQTI